MTLSTSSRSSAKRHMGPVHRKLLRTPTALGNWPSLGTTPESTDVRHHPQNRLQMGTALLGVFGCRGI